VTETGLLVAQGVVLLLMFGLVLAVVRSAARQVWRAAPPPMPMDDPVDTHDTAAHAVAAPAAAPVVAAGPPEPDPFAFAREEPAAAARAAEPPTVVPAALPVAPLPEPGDDDGMPAEGEGRSSWQLDANIAPRLVVERANGIAAGHEIPLGGGLTIGRSASNGLHLDDGFISHMHARILRRGSFYYVEDLGSTNGTYLNEQRIDGGAQLRVRDVLRMGESVLRYEE
jgi:hypothetical protein